MDNAPETTASDNALTGGFTPETSAAPAQVEGQATESQAPVESQAQPDTWTSGFDSDTKEYIENKSWKSPSELLQSYRNLEKLKGGSDTELFKIRPDMETDEWERVYTAMGRPESADKYSIESKDTDIPEVTDWFKSAAHELGLSDKQATNIYSQFNEKIETIAKGQMEERQMTHQNSLRDLAKEWGGSYESKVNLATRAAEAIGINSEMQAAIRDSGQAVGLLRALEKVGSMMGEGQMHGTNPMESKAAVGALSPQEAKAERDKKLADPQFKSRMFSPDKATREAANAELAPLYKAMTSG